MSSSSRSYPKGTFQQLLQSGKYKPGKAGGSPAQAPLVSVLGDDAQTGQTLTLGDVERRSGLYVLGKPGMGKTTLLVNLALQDIEHGHGVFFLDPHADAIADILRRLPVSRKDDVILLDVEDEARSFCINLLACKDVTSLKERTNTYTRAYNIFHTIWSKEWGPWLEMIVSNTLYAFIENQGYTLADVPLFLRDAAFREYLVQNIRFNKEPADFWREEFGNLLNERQQREQAQAALTRVRQLLTHPYVKHVIGYPTTTIDFRQIMAERKIILVSLSANLAENIKQFLGTILVSELLKAARDRVRIPQSQRHQFCVFVDEFQNFATPDFATFITEARKFSIATTIAHQERFGQLEVDRRILGATLATAHKIIYQPTVADAETVAKEFADRPEPARVEILQDEWVEELEKEWVEELEPAYVEILEEQREEHEDYELEDGVEPIMALSDQPFDHLIRTHSNARVSQLSGRLRELANALEIAQAETEQADVWTQKVSQERVFHHSPDGPDGIEYIATREQMLQGKQLINDLLSDIMQGTVAYGAHEMVDRLQTVAAALRGFIGFAQGVVWEKQGGVIDTSYTSWDRFGSHVIPGGRSASSGGWVDVNLETVGDLTDLTEVIVREVPTTYKEDIDRSMLTLSPSNAMRNFQRSRILAHLQASVGEHDERLWSSEDAEKKSEQLWAEYKAEIGHLTIGSGTAERNRVVQKREAAQRLSERYLHEVHFGPPQTVEEILVPPEGLSESKRQEWLADRRVMIEQFQPIAVAESRRLVDFLSELSSLCLALSSPEQHIFVPSGQMRPARHMQRHYSVSPQRELVHPRRELTHPRRELNHPRLELHHPQRSIADMVAEKELDLLDLATYTAYYKLTSTRRTDKGRLDARPLPAPHDLLIRTRLVKHILAISTYSIERSLIDKAIQIRQRQEDGQAPVSGSQPSPVLEDQENKTKRQRSIEIEE